MKFMPRVGFLHDGTMIGSGSRGEIGGWALGRHYLGFRCGHVQGSKQSSDLKGLLKEIQVKMLLIKCFFEKENSTSMETRCTYLT